MTVPRRQPSETRADASNPTSDPRAVIEAIFDDALDVPLEQRASWCDARCGDDLDLRREVELLLEAHDRDSPLDVPAAGQLAALVPDLGRGGRVGADPRLRELRPGRIGRAC